MTTDMPAPAASDLTTRQLTPEAAREEIKARVSDKEFGKRLLSDNAELKAAALAEWTKLHQTAYPPPAEITLANIKDLPANHELRRQAEQMESSIAALLKIADLNPQQLQEIRERRPIAEAEKQIARQQIELMKRDQDFRRRLLAGDRQASTDWTRLHQIISLPTASTKTTYPV